MTIYELTEALEAARRLLAERDAEIERLRDLLNQAHAERDQARSDFQDYAAILSAMIAADVPQDAAERAASVERARSALAELDDTYIPGGLDPLSAPVDAKK